HGLYMRRHVVRSLDIMNPPGIGGREALERAPKVGADIRVGVFLGDGGGRSMPHEDEKRAVLLRTLLCETDRLARNLGEGLSAGLDHECRSRNGLGREADNRIRRITHGLAIAAIVRSFSACPSAASRSSPPGGARSSR